MKRAGEKIAWLTAYDYPTAQFEEAAEIDVILVGDSLGMCVYGYPGTVPVIMDRCIVHSVIDDEALSGLRVARRPIEVNEETLALDVGEAAGPGGAVLGHAQRARTRMTARGGRS